MIWEQGDCKWHRIILSIRWSVIRLRDFDMKFFYEESLKDGGDFAIIVTATWITTTTPELLISTESPNLHIIKH